MSRNSAASTDLGDDFEHRRKRSYESDPDEPRAEKEPCEAVCENSHEQSSSPKESQVIDNDALEQVVSSKPSVNSVRAIPNGGHVAWLQVLGSFFLFFNTWGIVNTFGTYQTYYETGILSSSSPSNIAWIGSIQAMLLMFIGSLTGPLYDAGYVHQLLLTGSFLVVLGQMMLSLCTQYWQVVLAQAVCVGLGSGCLFVPSVAILSTYFSTRIALAMGIAASGSSLGGVIYPIVFHRLQPQLGFPWATRVIGFMMLATLALSNSLMRVRVLPAGRRKMFDASAWKEPPYLFFVCGTFMSFVGIYIPFFYLQSYAIETGAMTPDLGFYLLAVLNGASVFGRLIPNYLADKVGPFNVILPCTTVSGILCICLIPAKSSAAIIVLAAMYGFTSGTFVSLPPTIFVHVSSHARGMIGTRMGQGFAFTSIGLLIGTPIGGAILNASSFASVWIFGGVMTLVGAFSILVARICKGGWSVAKVV